MRIAAILLALPLSGFCIARTGLESITGIVRNQVGKPISGAVVEMEDMRTLEVRSFVTPRSGKYYFYDVAPNEEYSLRAHYRGRWSKNHRLMRFDSAKKAITLTVERQAE